MIAIESGSHWYDRDGKPHHDADLRIARKQLYYASVTTIDKAMFKNEFLERYKLIELARAAFENPRQPHEEVEDYGKRIHEISIEKTRVAGLFGTAVHKAIEELPTIPSEPNIIPYVQKFSEWKDANVLSVVSTEQILVDNDIGVAGTRDVRMIHKTHGLLTADYKTQGVKVDKKGRKTPNFYDSFPRQLAFYESVEAKAEGRFPKLNPCMSVVIDSTEPSAPYEKLYSSQEMLSAYEDFLIGVYRWHKAKNYWPVGQWSLIDKLKELHSA